MLQDACNPLCRCGFVKGSSGISNYCFLLDCMWTHAGEIGSSGWESAGAACCVQCGCNLATFDASPHQKGDTESHLAERRLALFTGVVFMTSGKFNCSRVLICLNKLHNISATTWLSRLSNSYSKIVLWKYKKFAFPLHKDSQKTGGSQVNSTVVRCHLCKKSIVKFPRCLMFQSHRLRAVITQWKQVETIAAQTHSGNMRSNTVPMDKSWFASSPVETILAWLQCSKSKF